MDHTRVLCVYTSAWSKEGKGNDSGNPVVIASIRR